MSTEKQQPQPKRGREDEQFHNEDNTSSKRRKLNEDSSPNNSTPRVMIVEKNTFETSPPRIGNTEVVSCNVSSFSSVVSQPHQLSPFKQTENLVTSSSTKNAQINLNPDQKEFIEHVFEVLYDGFNKCRLISKGEVIEKSFADSYSFSLTQIAFAGGGLLPVIGTACTGMNIVSNAVQAGMKKFDEAAIKSRASKIGDFFCNPHELYLVCNTVSVLLSLIYAEQIERLSSSGKRILGNFIAVQIFHYIATDEGKNDTYLKAFINAALGKLQNSFKATLRLIDPSLSPIQDPSYVKLEWKMLNAIIFWQPSFDSGVRLDLKRDLEKNQNIHFFIEGILRTGVREQKDGVDKFYSHSDSDCEKYGYRFLPEGYAEQLGYKEELLQQKQLNSHSV